jgi:cell division protease FtsH
MVAEWGMSDTLGPIHYSTHEEHVFLGRDIGKAKEHSENTQVAIDEEVKRILMDQKAVAEKIVRENVDTLHRLAKALLEKETLDAEDIERIIKGEDLGGGPGGGGGGTDSDAEGSGDSVSEAA